MKIKIVVFLFSVLSFSCRPGGSESTSEIKSNSKKGDKGENKKDTRSDVPLNTSWHCLKHVYAGNTSSNEVKTFLQVRFNDNNEIECIGEDDACFYHGLEASCKNSVAQGVKFPLLACNENSVDRTKSETYDPWSGIGARALCDLKQRLSYLIGSLPTSGN